ncbi:MAG: FmdB family transcriptional regulator, partial [Actinomycetota bacterium]|nr:FmdB family transcriptional regulator [Actinomycetota bacterium]
MPTYQYVCTECGTPLEAQQAFSDDPLTECPTCAGRLRKVFSPVGVVFKGSGFYRTDSKAESKPDSKGESKGESKPDGKGESKGESKPDGKGESKGDSTKSEKSEKKA